MNYRAPLAIGTFSIVIGLAGAAAMPVAPAVPATAPAARPVLPKVDEPADRPAIRLNANHTPDTGWMNRHNALVTRAKAGNIDLYFEGDSITDFWERSFRANFEKYFAGWKAADFGISADRTEHVLWRIENGELDGVKPRAIVLLIGTNNLPKEQGVYSPKTPAEVAAGVKAILDVMKEKQPQAKILLLSVFPREDKLASSNPDLREDLNPKVKELNALLAKFDDGKQVKFLDIYDKFTDKEGKLLPGVMRDKLHPSEQGYDVWGKAITPTLTEWLGPPAATQAK